MFKRFFAIIAGILIFCSIAEAQMRVVDENHNPIMAASILDADGNMIGLTLSDGFISNVPASAYPITIRCIGYEDLIINEPIDKNWEMTPTVYELKELVVVPVKRNVLRQTFYVREYFSMNNDCDTITYFIEHMAERFIPTSKDAKFGGNSSLRIINTRQYSHFQIGDKDSVAANPKKEFPSLLSIIELSNEEIVASATNSQKDSSKNGKRFVQKQNAQTFTTIEDVLAECNDHKSSPWPLKLLGFTMEFNQFYTTQAYRANSKGIYLPKDLLEASFVIEADGKGKHLRKALKSEKPIIIRSLIELYVVDNEYLTKEDAKDEYKNKLNHVKFVIPSTVPPLNQATLKLVNRVNTEAKK